jgi:hypothetical protein
METNEMMGKGVKRETDIEKKRFENSLLKQNVPL